MAIKINRQKFRDILLKANITDLRIFCDDLYEVYEHIVPKDHNTRAATLDIINHFDGRGRLAELAACAKKVFDKEDWGAVEIEVEDNQNASNDLSFDIMPSAELVGRSINSASN